MNPVANLQDVDFARPCGVELTFVPNRSPRAKGHPYGFTPQVFDKLHEQMKGLAVATGMELDRRNTFASGWGDPEKFTERWGYLGRDPGCVEWSSPILRTWEDAQGFYEGATALAEMVGLTTWHPKQVGGMGHIHMAMSHGNADRVAQDLAFRPYLSWLFAEPAQNQYCASVWRAARWSPRDEVIEGWSGMCSILRYNYIYKTLEWRAFDSACEWEEQEEHIAFYQRYVQWVLAGGADVFTPLRKSHPRHAWLWFRDKDKGYARCVEAFDELIGDLGLPWDRYEWYTECHLKSQFEWGDRL